MKLFIIRHGDPDYAHDTLTERGWEEARLLGERLMKENITKVFCSPLGRAQATAKPFLEASGMRADTRDFLREFPRPIIEPLPALGLGEEERRTCPWDMSPAVFTAFADTLTDPEKWDTLPVNTKGGVDAGVREVKEKWLGLLAELGLERDGYFYRVKEGFSWEEIDRENVAVFCHMGLGSLLLSDLAHVAPPLFWQMFRVMPTSVSTVLFQRRSDGTVQTKIFSLGDTTHLAPIGLTYRG
ncbi:MAG: histidine phosphatase family protein [Lachnospiraceae bacterium]|nr:histidine phosphatase family protein [Lachnospiraceae bacterium]